MYIGILTHPLHTNYGGILQAYALTHFLKCQGHQVEIINREYDVPKEEFIVKIKQYVKKLLGINSDKYIKRFIRKRFKLSKMYLTTSELSKNISNRYDAIIVGSDQVWRPKYSPCITNYFLDFAVDSKIKKIAYAASFGVDEWEFTEIQTKECSYLAKQFDYISVREKSGIYLCNKYLNVDAELVLDPTFLLSMNDYIKMAGTLSEESYPDGMFCYILDDNQNISDFISLIGKKTGLTPNKILPSNKLHIIPSIEQWIRSFVNAKLVLTDSFHGAVFSLIFNKPFWVVGNEKRGMARFKSLLSIFNLQSRMIQTDDVDRIDFFEPIDWNYVNYVIESKRKDSIFFINKSLGLC